VLSGEIRLKTKKFLKKAVFSFVIMLFIINTIPFVTSTSTMIRDNNDPGSPLNFDWWPMFRHNPTHTGISTSSAPETNEVLWSYQLDNFISSSPIISNGRVFVSSMDGRIYCFDMTNGDILWDYATLGQITSTPAYYNGMVYVGSQDSYFYCIDAEDGSLAWSFDTNFMIESSPTIKDDRVYFGSSDGSLYCLNANSGSLIWSFPTGNVIWSSPAVTDEHVYFGDLNGVFFCLDAVDGGLVWSYATGSGIWSSPAVYGDKVFFGSNDKYFYCLDAYDGDFIWSYDTGNEVHSSPAVAYGYVYVGTSGIGLFCFDIEDGDLVWRDIIANGVWSQPSIADSKIYFGTDPCCGGPAFVLCNDAHTGEMIWEHNVGAAITVRSSPAIAGGKVVVTTSDGQIITFGENLLIADANGPYRNFVNEMVQFYGDAYGGSPDYLWFWDFGDGDTSDEQNPTHVYEKVGNYNVVFTVTDSEDSQSTDSTYVDVEGEINNPPSAPVINGPTSIKIGVEYDFFFNSADPDGDYVKYVINWGDGSTDETSLVPSGDDVKVAHVWNENGEHVISARAVDTNGLAGPESTFRINVPRSRVVINQFLTTFFQKFFDLMKHFQQS
jgi:outer membrane protein assembly factor BamB